MSIVADPQRICFTLKLKTGASAAYRARHAAIWPEMRDALRESGWHNYSLFLTEDETVIGYLECDDFAACQARMQGLDVNARWQAEMAGLFDLDGAAPDTVMTPIPAIFHLA